MRRKRSCVLETENLILECIRHGPIDRKVILQRLKMRPGTFDRFLHLLRKTHNIVIVDGRSYEILSKENIVFP